MFKMCTHINKVLIVLPPHSIEGTLCPLLLGLLCLNLSLGSLPSLLSALVGGECEGGSLTGKCNSFVVVFISLFKRTHLWSLLCNGGRCFTKCRPVPATSKVSHVSALSFDTVASAYVFSFKFLGSVYECSSSKYMRLQVCLNMKDCSWCSSNICADKNWREGSFQREGSGLTVV